MLVINSISVVILGVGEWVISDRFGILLDTVG